MRTISTAQGKAYNSTSQQTRVRLRIKDDGGTFQEWTALRGQDHAISIDWGEDVDSPGMDAAITLHWRRFYDNASPWVTGTRTSGYLDIGRELKIDIAIIPEDASAGASDWIECFHGRIDTLDLANEPGQITARDVIMAELADRWVEDETIYGDNGATEDIEDVIDELLTDWTGGTITLETPVATSFAVNEYKQQRMPVLQAIQDLVALIGWDIRPMWHAASSSWRLTLYEPTRTSPSVDRTFGPALWLAVERVNLDLSRIRNVIEVTYVDGTDANGDITTDTVTRTDATSVTRYGRRWMEVVEGSTSQIDTSTEAQNLGDAILADLKDPELGFGVSVPLFPFIEINDYYTFEADGRRFGADQSLAVQGYRHSIEAGQLRTAIQASGVPKAGVLNWLEREARPGQGANKRDLVPAAPENLGLQSIALGTNITWDWPRDGDWDFVEVHRSTSNGFTPNSSTLVATVRGTRFVDRGVSPGTTYYYKTIVKAKEGLRGAASSQASVSPSYVERDELEAKIRAGVRLTMSVDQTGETTSDFTVAFDTVSGGDATYADTGNHTISPGYDLFALLTARIAPEPGGMDATTWRLQVEEAGSGAVLADTGDQSTSTDLVISELVDLASGDDYLCKITFTGTSVDIESDRSHFAFQATLGA